MNTKNTVYPDLGAFYEADPRRLDTVELDYGMHWRDVDSQDRWRVSYVPSTREIYACAEHSGVVILLGAVPPESVVPGHPARTSDLILEGWDSHSRQPGGLNWLRERMADLARQDEARG